MKRFICWALVLLGSFPFVAAGHTGDGLLNFHIGVAKPFIDNKALGPWMDSTLGRPVGNGFQYFTIALDGSLPGHWAFGTSLTTGIGEKKGTPSFAELKAGYNFLHSRSQELTLFGTWGLMYYFISKVDIPGYVRRPREVDEDLLLRGRLGYYGLDLHYMWKLYNDGEAYLPIGLDIEAGHYYDANPGWDIGYRHYRRAHWHDYDGLPNFGRNFFSVGVSIGIGGVVSGKPHGAGGMPAK